MKNDAEKTVRCRSSSRTGTTRRDRVAKLTGMTIEQLREAHKRKPFQPFTIHLADGRSFFVKHPEFLSHAPHGRTIIVYGEGEDFSILDLLLVTEIEVHPSSSSSGEAA